jgi:hypothetical protein
MLEEAFHIHPHVFETNPASVRVSLYPYENLKKTAVNAFLGTVVNGAIGVAPSYGSRCVLSSIAFSSQSQVLVIQFTKPTISRRSQKVQRSKANLNSSLLGDILCHRESSKYTFKMDKFSASLYLDLGEYITNGVDLLSVGKGERHSLDALASSLGGETTLKKAGVIALFKDDEANTDIRTTATQAWVACHAGLLEHMSQRLTNLAKINTKDINIEVSQISGFYLFAECFLSISPSSPRLFVMLIAS